MRHAIGSTVESFFSFKYNSEYYMGSSTIFKKNFDTITFNMYPIYGNIGFGGYVF